MASPECGLVHPEFFAFLNLHRSTPMQASEAVAGLAIQPGTTQTGVTAVTQPPEEPPEEDWEEDPDEPSQTEMADAAQGATQAFEDVGGWEAPNLSWKAKVVNRAPLLRVSLCLTDLHRLT